jgi:hypothetical protein
MVSAGPLARQCGYSIRCSMPCSKDNIFVTTCHERFRGLRGRDAGYPAPPAQTRTCSLPASGSSVGLAAAQGGLSSEHSPRPHLGHAGSLDGDCVQELGEALPADTPPFPATPIAPLGGTVHGPGKDAREGSGVAMEPIVAIVTSQPSIEAVEESVPGHMPIRLNPCRAPSTRTLQFLASGAALDPRHALSVFLPERCEAHIGGLCVIRLPSGFRRACPLTVLLRLPDGLFTSPLRLRHSSVSGFPLPGLNSRIPASNASPRRSLWGLPRSSTSLFLPAAAWGLRRTFTSSPKRMLLCGLRGA